MDEIITKLQKEYNLVQTVVNDFDRYMEKVTAVWKSLEEKGNIPADKSSYVINKSYFYSNLFIGLCWQISSPAKYRE